MALSIVAMLLAVGRAAAGNATSMHHSVTAEEFSAFNLLKSSFIGCRAGAASADASGQKMKVISAGQGRTGTASLKTALARLGLKPYHMKDGVMDTPGHMDLWLEYSEKELQQKGSGKAVLSRIVSMMAQDGFNATTDMPACYIYDELRRAYPDARVLLTVRSSADVWATSVRATIGRNLDLFNRAPYRFIPFMQALCRFNAWMWTSFGLSDDGFDPLTRMPTHDALAKGHDAWVAKVKRSVPAHKLLVFRPEDGYKPLCAFLSPVDPAVAAACKEVLASGEAYPHVNDTATMLVAYAVFTAISYVAIAAPVWVAALGWYCFARRATTKKKAA